MSGLLWSANLSLLFGEVAFRGALRPGPAAGSTPCRVHVARRRRRTQLRAAQRDAGLSVALFNVAGDMAADATSFREAAISALELAAVFMSARASMLWRAAARPRPSTS